MEANRVRDRGRRAGLADGGTGVLAPQRRLGLPQLRDKLGEVRNVCVPLKECRDAAGQLLRQPVQLPHGGRHGLVVRVHKVAPAVGRSREVNLHDGVVRQTPNVVLRVKAVVVAGHVDVVYVEQQPAPGLSRQL